MCGASENAVTPNPHGDPLSRTTPDAALLARIADVHCHPTDDWDYAGPVFMSGVKLGTVCAMSSTLESQRLVADLYDAFPHRVIPFFGVHPWFTHSLSNSTTLPTAEEHYTSLFSASSALSTLLPVLPPPTLLSTFLDTLATSFAQNPKAWLGEVGIDKVFRLPATDQPKGPLSNLATPLSHQIEVVMAQINVALRFRRNISFHSVRAPKDTLELLGRCKEKEGWAEINICMHSFGGSPESIRDIQKAHHNTFFSFASVVTGRSPRFADMVRAVDGDKLLVESDGPARYLDEWVWTAVEAIAHARGWSIEECTDILEQNWKRFCEPPEALPLKALSKRERREQALKSRIVVTEARDEPDVQVK